jgi:threonine dehydrogenase-like Zn-dependent dehydrogenase
MRPEFSVFIEPGVYALRWIRQARIRYGDRVAIVGMGAIGLMGLQYAMANGAHGILSVDQDPNRLAIATRLGSYAVRQAKTSADLPGDQQSLFDVVFDFTGAKEGVEIAETLARADGEIHVASGRYAAKGDVVLQNQSDTPYNDLLDHAGSADPRFYVDLVHESIAAKRVIVWPFITNYVRFDQADDFYREFMRSPLQFVKSIIRYDEQPR